MMSISDRDRRLLFLWYVRQLPVEEIAREVGLSRRQCFRRRSHALSTIVEQGNPQEAA